MKSDTSKSFGAAKSCEITVPDQTLAQGYGIFSLFDAQRNFWEHPEPNTQAPIGVFDFWRRVKRKGPDECWPWKDGLKRHGRLRIGRKHFSPHRVAYVLAKGPIPPGKIVRHTCDNPPCCNPAHLVVGTHLDNVSDMIERGSPGWGRQRGIYSGIADIPEDIRVAIRACGLARRTAAAKFGVTERAIRRILGRPV